MARLLDRFRPAGFIAAVDDLTIGDRSNSAMTIDSAKTIATSGRLRAVAPGGVVEEEPFWRLVDPHRRSLLAHCYRMLGSLADAEDAVQDALMRAWRGLESFEGRSAPRTWLHQIATNVCLDALARRRRRVLPIDYGPAADPRDSGTRLDAAMWIEPYPGVVGGGAEDRDAPEARYEAREAVELAFVAALQYLPPRQRAVLILRDVLRFSTREVAEMLRMSVASVNSSLQRSRSTMRQRLPDRSQQATVRSLGDGRVRAVVQRLVDAFERGDIPVIIALLAEDAVFQMPPYTAWCRGRDALAESWLMPEGQPSRLRYVAMWANAQPAVGVYAVDPSGCDFVPVALDVLTLSGEQIAAVTAFRRPEILPPFEVIDPLAD
jgi:RNA polymerase sigma-70 factor (ECF subfamily)